MGCDFSSNVVERFDWFNDSVDCVDFISNEYEICSYTAQSSLDVERILCHHLVN